MQPQIRRKSFSEYNSSFSVGKTSNKYRFLRVPDLFYEIPLLVFARLDSHVYMSIAEVAPFDGVNVVVQFYPWFKFYFFCFKLIIIKLP